MNTIGYKTKAQQVAEANQANQIEQPLSDPQEEIVSEAHLTLRMTILSLEEMIINDKSPSSKYKETVLMQYKTFIELNAELNVKNRLLSL